MKSQIIIFEGNQKDGIFSRNKKFYPKDYTSEDIYNSIKRDRISLGTKYNFSGLKMLQITQKMEDNDSYPNNKSILINKNIFKKMIILKKKSLQIF